MKNARTARALLRARLANYGSRPGPLGLFPPVGLYHYGAYFRSCHHIRLQAGAGWLATYVFGVFRPRGLRMQEHGQSSWHRDEARERHACASSGGSPSCDAAHQF